MAACIHLDSPQQGSDTRVTQFLVPRIVTNDGEAAYAIAGSVCLITRAASCTARPMCCTSLMLAAPASCCAVVIYEAKSRPHRSAGTPMSVPG